MGIFTIGCYGNLTRFKVEILYVAWLIVHVFKVIAATNQNLEQLIKEGKFREDLYYRLNIMRKNRQPLQERIKRPPAKAGGFRHKCRRLKSFPRLKSCSKALAKASSKLD
ncbi:hypothetical protein CAI16_17330 [Virgibacillus dokdonensis]|uniref:Sigma-54 factor interaction domain-containing protein n=1 Tax=Virgibacillus dokdonensis TaxID=302167 RepID=A0A3E0WKD1_9BACI|nr:hypothetical protein CAI16_17330 [Virgibacillus dokdonensis]